MSSLFQLYQHTQRVRTKGEATVAYSSALFRIRALLLFPVCLSGLRRVGQGNAAQAGRSANLALLVEILAHLLGFEKHLMGRRRVSGRCGDE